MISTLPGPTSLGSLNRSFTVFRAAAMLDVDGHKVGALRRWDITPTDYVMSSTDDRGCGSCQSRQECRTVVLLLPST